MTAKTIDLYWLEERIAIKLQEARKPSERQEHDALNETLRELKAQWGEIDVPQWPRSKA